MSEGTGEAEFTCPFCGRDMDGQERLLDHFAEKHDIDGFADV